VIGKGFVIVIHSNRIAKLYNLTDILNGGLQQTYNIGEVLPDKSEHVVGQEPLGFPLNVSIRAEPTVLYSVACHDYDVAFSSFFPPMCLTTAKDDCYKVFSMSGSDDSSIIKKQKKSPFLVSSYKRMGYDYNNDLVFHPDESQRVIHLAGKLLQIHEISSEMKSSNMVFSFNADPDNESTETLSDDFSEDDDYNPGSMEAVYCYDDELEILAVLAWRFIIPDQEEYGDNHTRVRLEAVTFFDNNSYRLLRTIPIDHAVRLGTTEQPSLSLDLDRHILLIRVRTTSRTRTLIWRLQETEIDEAQLRSIATTFSSNGSGEKISAAETTGPNNGTSMEGQRKTNSCTENPTARPQRPQRPRRSTQGAKGKTDDKMLEDEMDQFSRENETSRSCPRRAAAAASLASIRERSSKKDPDWTAENGSKYR